MHLLSLNGGDHSGRSRCLCNTHTEDMENLIRKILARQNLVIGNFYYGFVSVNSNSKYKPTI